MRAAGVRFRGRAERDHGYGDRRRRPGAARRDRRGDDRRSRRGAARRRHRRRRAVRAHRPAAGRVRPLLQAAGVRPREARRARPRGGGDAVDRRDAVGRPAGGRPATGTARPGDDARDAGSHADRTQSVVVRPAGPGRQGPQAGRGRRRRRAAVPDDGPRARRRPHHRRDRRDDRQHDGQRRPLPGLPQPDARGRDVVHDVGTRGRDADRRPAHQHDSQRGRRPFRGETLHRRSAARGRQREPASRGAGRQSAGPGQALRRQRVVRRSGPPRPAAVLHVGAPERRRLRHRLSRRTRRRSRREQPGQRERAADVAGHAPAQALGDVRQGAEAPVRPARPGRRPGNGGVDVDLAALRHRDREVDRRAERPDAGRVRLLAVVPGLGRQLLPAPAERPEHLPGAAGRRRPRGVLRDPVLPAGRLGPARGAVGAGPGRRPLVQPGLDLRRPARPAVRSQGRRREQQLHAPLGVSGRAVLRHGLAQLQLRNGLLPRPQPPHQHQQRPPRAALRGRPEPPRTPDPGPAPGPPVVRLQPPPGAGEPRRRAALRPDGHAGPGRRLQPPVEPGLPVGLQRRLLRAGLVDRRPADPRLRHAARLRRHVGARRPPGPGPFRARAAPAGASVERAAPLRPRPLAPPEHGLRPVRRRPHGAQARLEQVRARHRRQPGAALRLRVPRRRRP